MNLVSMPHLNKYSEQLVLDYIDSCAPLNKGLPMEQFLSALTPFLHTIQTQPPAAFEDWKRIVATLADVPRQAPQHDFFSTFIMDLFRLAYLCAMGKQYKGIDSLRDPSNIPPNLAPRPLECERKRDIISQLPPTVATMSNLFTSNNDTASIALGDNGLPSAQDNTSRLSLTSSTQFAVPNAANGEPGTEWRTSTAEIDALDRARVEREYIATNIGDAWAKYKVPLDELCYIQETQWRSGVEIGKGKFGKVSRATLHGVEVAAKSFRLGDLDPFFTEVYYCARLRHPGIVKYLGFYMTPHNKTYFMELMQYSIFSEYIESETKMANVPINVRVRWALQVATAIKYMHSMGIIHRDINTKNMVVSADHVAKVCDFTFACAYNTKKRVPQSPEIPPIAALTTKLYVGTPRYMSPEIENRKCDNWEAADIWGLGIAIFDILTGVRPFRNLSTQEEVREDILNQLTAFNERQDGYSDRLEDSRMSIKAIPEMLNLPESHNLLDTLTRACSFDPNQRPLAEEIAAALSTYDMFLKSGAHRRAREQARMDRLPQLAVWPKNFSTFPPPSLASFVK